MLLNLKFLCSFLLFASFIHPQFAIPQKSIIVSDQLETNQNHSKWRTKEKTLQDHRVCVYVCVCVSLSDSLCLSDQEKNEILTITKIRKIKKKPDKLE